MMFSANIYIVRGLFCLCSFFVSSNSTLMKENSHSHVEPKHIHSVIKFLSKYFGFSLFILANNSKDKYNIRFN